MNEDELKGEMMDMQHDSLFPQMPKTVAHKDFSLTNQVYGGDCWNSSAGRRGHLIV